MILLSCQAAEFASDGGFAGAIQAQQHDKKPASPPGLAGFYRPASQNGSDELNDPVMANGGSLGGVELGQRAVGPYDQVVRSRQPHDAFEEGLVGVIALLEREIVVDDRGVRAPSADPAAASVAREAAAAWESQLSPRAWAAPSPARPAAAADRRS